MKQADLQIRTAGNNDLDQLVDLWLQLMDYHKDQARVFKINPGNQRPGISKILKTKLENKSTRIFVALVKSEMAGFIICSYNQGSPAFELNRKGYIAETLVSENYRGLEIGSQLYETAENWLIANKVDHIQLQVSMLNSRGKKFWNNQGFEAVTQVMNKTIRPNQ